MSLGSLKSFGARRERKYPENSEVSGCSLAPFCPAHGSDGEDGGGSDYGGGCASVLDGDRVHAYEERVPNNREFERTSGRTWPKSSGTFGTV